MPLYTRADVAKHKTKEDRIWVTYKTGVYDVTDFISMHPGGVRILLAAGSALDPFWAMYHQHTTKQVLGILEQHRIGNLKPGEEPIELDLQDPYASDPERSSMLPVRSAKPFNAETVAELIPDHYITPIDLYYKRHHHPVPVISDGDYRLVIAYEDANIVQLNLSDLKTKFEQHEITVTLQCAGNRRSEFNEYAPVQGLEWEASAVSTAKWKGVWLRDVLDYSGLGDHSALCERAGVAHVHFEGNDQPYDASVPLAKALNCYGNVLIATEMNGVPIPADHGGPVRVIVPGHVAARSVKWLRRVVASRQESSSNWQRGVAYKGFPPNIKSFDKIDPNDYVSVQELPVNSAICVPKPGAQVDVDDESITVKGWAWSGGGRAIVRVDISVDDGETWQQAELKEGKDQKEGLAWAWTLWEAEVAIPKEVVANVQAKRRGGKKEVTLICRAVDRSFNVQPETPKSIWNLRGILNNAWHRVEVEVVPAEEE